LEARCYTGTLGAEDLLYKQAYTFVVTENKMNEDKRFLHEFVIKSTPDIV